jgi:hypothetical protein
MTAPAARMPAVHQNVAGAAPHRGGRRGVSGLGGDAQNLVAIGWRFTQSVRLAVLHGLYEWTWKAWGSRMGVHRVTPAAQAMAAAPYAAGAEQP